MSKVIESIKKIYPEITGGFMYWETKQDLTEWENPIEGLIWENTKFEKPTWEQIEANFCSVELEKEKEVKLAQCLKYLNQTDWYVVRLSDPTSIETIPNKVSNNRGQARILQEEIKACKTLEELEQININFI